MTCFCIIVFWSFSGVQELHDVAKFAISKKYPFEIAISSHSYFSPSQLHWSRATETFCVYFHAPCRASAVVKKQRVKHAKQKSWFSSTRVNLYSTGVHFCFFFRFVRCVLNSLPNASARALSDFYVATHAFFRLRRQSLSVSGGSKSKSLFVFSSVCLSSSQCFPLFVGWQAASAVVSIVVVCFGSKCDWC